MITGSNGEVATTSTYAGFDPAMRASGRVEKLTGKQAISALTDGNSVAAVELEAILQKAALADVLKS
ncbi:MAG: hypothetical protein AAB383_06095 [Patescibacteria group bacterium]